MEETIENTETTQTKPKDASALKDIAADNDLESRETSDAINKAINSPADKLSPKQNNTASLSQSSHDALAELCAKDVMQRDICWCTLEASVENVMDEMHRYRCSHVAVGENNNLQGLLSRADLLEAKSPYLRPEFAKWRRPIDYASMKIKVKWLIKNKTYEVLSSDESLENVIRKMLWTQSSCVAVIDKFEKVIGIITAEDIFDSLLAYKAKIYDERRTADIKKAANNKRITSAIAELIK